MRDYEILDAVVEVIGDYARFHQVDFGAVGSEANDAPNPTGRHAGDFQQLLFGSMVYVDPRFGRRRIFGSFWRTGGVPVLTIGGAGRANASNGNCANRDERSCPHCTIVFFAVLGLQVIQVFNL